LFTGKFLKFLFFIFFMALPVKFPEKDILKRPGIIKKVRNKKRRKKSGLLLTERDTFVIKENVFFEIKLLKGINLN